MSRINSQPYFQSPRAIIAEGWECYPTWAKQMSSAPAFILDMKETRPFPLWPGICKALDLKWLQTLRWGRELPTIAQKLDMESRDILRSLPAHSFMHKINNLPYKMNPVTDALAIYKSSSTNIPSLGFVLELRVHVKYQ